MTVQAQSADGVTHEFPDGTDPAVIGKVMKSYAAAHTKTSGPGFKFSDNAITQASGRPGTSVVYMKPSAYLALTPDLPQNPKTDRKGASLKASLDKGDNVDEVPSLEVTVGKDGHAKVTDQDGRHRALFAQQAGVDLIPVAVQRFGDKAPIKQISGLRDDAGAVPFDFKPVAMPKPSATPNVSRGTSPEKNPRQIDPGGEFMHGVEDPFIGIGQLAVHGAEAGARAVGATNIANNLKAVTDRTDANLDKREAKYQQARGADAGFDYGRLAGNIVNPVNLVPLGEVGAIERLPIFAKRAEFVFPKVMRWLGKNAASTGSAGAVIAALNPVTGGDFWDEKTKQAAVGLAGGTVVPPALRGAGTAIRAGTTTVMPLFRWMSGVKGPNASLSAAEKEIMRRLSQGVEGGGPTAQDMLDLAAKTPDKPLTLMDVGSQPVNALAGRTYRSGGTAKQRIGDALVERNEAQGQRLEGDVGKGLSADKAYSTVQAMQQSRANAAAPLYKKAYEANQNIASPMIDRILSTPAGKQALTDAREQMQNDMSKMGVPDAEIAEQIKESGQAVPFKGGVASGLKLRTLDYVKRALYDQESVEARAGRKNAADIIKNLRQSLVSEMDKADVTARAGPNSTKPEGGLYKQARAAYSGPSQSMDALEFGQNALKPGTSIDENAARFKELNANDQEFARIGLAQSLRDMIGKKDVGTNAARTLARNPAIQSRVRPFFRSDADYQKFMHSVTAEDNMFHAQMRTMGGSQTAERQGEDSDATSNALAHAAHAGVHMHSGNPLRALDSLKRSIAEFAKRPNPEIADEISRLLTAPFNQQGSAGMNLLRHFSAVAPGTRNYLSQAANRVGRASVVPTGAAAGQITQP